MEEELSKIINLLNDNQLTSISVKHGDDEIKVSKTLQPQTSESNNNLLKVKTDDTSKIIKAPGVGVFYASPSPNEEPFVIIGDMISAETTVGIIESMKMMTEIKAGIPGIIKEIYVTDGHNIEYGQKLFRLE